MGIMPVERTVVLGGLLPGSLWHVAVIPCCFQASRGIADKVHDSYILKEVTGSDHCPLGVIIKKQ